MDGQEDSEVEMESEDGSINMVGDDDYGDEYDEEIDEQEAADAGASKAKSNSKSDKKKKFNTDDRGFASYEDFADLLEEGVTEANSKSKEKVHLKKRTHNDFTAAQSRFMKKKAGGGPDTEELE